MSQSNVQRFVSVHEEANRLLRNTYDLDGASLYEQGWRFQFSNTQRRIGDCSHKSKLIRFSKHYLNSSSDQITDTLLHEIAHALVGPGHGHDRTWRQMAIIMGADPNATPDEDAASQLKNTAKPNYRIKCMDCGWFVDRFRLKKSLLDPTRDRWCPKCKSRDIKFYKIVNK